MDRLLAMETFVRVVDAGSFSAAAKQLSMGQSGVSKIVAQLEAHLGVTLLLRSTRALQLTEAGERFYERAQRTVREAADAEADARGAATTLSGRLKVTASLCFARLHILPKLPQFLSDHPDLSLDMMLDDRIVDVVKEGVDLGLRTGPLTNLELTTKKIASSRILVMAGAKYLQKHGTPKTPKDLLAHRVIFRNRDGDRRVLPFEGQPITLTPHLRVSSTEGLREAVLADVGIAVVTEWLFTPELVTGAVRPVLEEWKLPSATLSAVYASRRPSTKARSFVAFVEAALKSEAETMSAGRRLSVVRVS